MSKTIYLSPYHNKRRIVIYCDAQDCGNNISIPKNIFTNPVFKFLSKPFLFLLSINAKIYLTKWTQIHTINQRFDFCDFHKGEMPGEVDISKLADELQKELDKGKNS